MIHSLRHRLWLVRYYSANRPQSPWSKAAETVLIVGFFIALPATWLCDQLVVRERVTHQYDGGVMRIRNGTPQTGTLSAFIVSDDVSKRRWRDGVPVANLTIETVAEHRGWPLVTTRTAPMTRIDWRLFDPEAGYRDTFAGFDDEADLHAALHEPVIAHGSSEFRAAWERTEASAEPIIMSWIFGATLWWVMMYFAGLVAILMMRFGWFLFKRRQTKHARRRTAENRCVNCGYQLHGLEFNERCPECGSFVY